MTHRGLIKRDCTGLIIVLSLAICWQGCSKKPKTVAELFPGVVFDEKARAKQFAVVATGTDPMIDDLEDGDLNGLALDGRNWSWSQFDDMTSGVQYLTIVQSGEAPGAGNNVLYIKGGNWGKSGAGISANLVNLARPRSYGNYDASAYSGIRFWIKASGIHTVKISIGIPETTSVEDGGGCQKNCPNNFTCAIKVSEAWTKIEIPFQSFTLAVGKTSLPLDPVQIKGIHFLFEPNTDYQVWLDDLSFTLK